MNFTKIVALPCANLMSELVTWNYHQIIQVKHHKKLKHINQKQSPQLCRRTACVGTSTQHQDWSQMAGNPIIHFQVPGLGETQ